MADPEWQSKQDAAGYKYGGDGIGVRKEDTTLLAALNKALDDMDAELVHEFLEFGDAADLQGPATDTDRERFEFSIRSLSAMKRLPIPSSARFFMISLPSAPEHYAAMAL